MTLARVVDAAIAAGMRYEEALAAAWRRELDRQVDTAAGRLEAHTASLTAATPARWHVPDADEIDRLVDDELATKKATDPLRVRIVEATMSTVLVHFDLDFDVANPLAKHVFLQLGKKITQVNQQTRLMIMDAVQYGHDEGLSIPDTVALVRRRVGGMSVMRATRIARTELTTGTNAASLAAVRIADEGHTKSWLATPDERTRETHAQAEDDYADGIPLEQPFSVGGAAMQHPGDPDGPPEEVVNCRCTQLFHDPPGVAASGYALYAQDRRSAMPRRTQQNLELAARIRAAAPAPAADAPADEPAAESTAWEATLVTEGVASVDMRRFEPGALEWRDLPLTLMGMFETGAYGHEGATVIGRIDNITREGNAVVATGVFDTGEAGVEMARLVGEGTIRGVSIDFMIHAAEIIEVIPEGAEPGDELEEDDIEYQLNITSATIVGATVCPMQAFDEGLIAIAASAEGELPRVTVVTHIERFSRRFAAPASLTASALGIPTEPPAEWFDHPEPDEATPLTVLDTGQVFGHAAAWGTCHLANPEGAGVCTTPPHSATGYAYFNLKTRKCADGSEQACGTITLGTRHANLNLARQAAAEHYDHTGHAVADVRAYEGKHGIWLAGALRPDVPAEKIVELRGATVSGDWRPIGRQGRELVAVLAVNVPGFPVPRPSALAASGSEGALIAAGIVQPNPHATRSEAASATLAALYARAAGGLDALLELAEA